MKKLMLLMIMAGLVGISSCASNEANMESAENDAEMAKDKADVAMDDAKADVKEAEVETSDAAAEVASMEEAEADVATDTEDAKQSVMASDMATDDSASAGNKVSVCKNAGQVRTITVIYDDEESGKACKVNYEKSSGTQTLWTANSDKDYCLEKAEAFVQKQEGWGWDCSPLQ